MAMGRRRKRVRHAGLWTPTASGTFFGDSHGCPEPARKAIGSAAALFQRFGYARVSIRDITSSIDIPKGTFYNHFKSKEALASAILSRHFDALMEALGQTGGETAGARLRPHFESITPSASLPTPAHQHVVGGGSDSPLRPDTADRQRCPALEY
jgi:AcrR family transcriptional regulator